MEKATTVSNTIKNVDCTEIGKLPHIDLNVTDILTFRPGTTLLREVHESRTEIEAPTAFGGK